MQGERRYCTVNYNDTHSFIKTLTAEPIWFSFTGNLVIGIEMVLGYFVFFGYGLEYFSDPPYPFEYIHITPRC